MSNANLHTCRSFSPSSAYVKEGTCDECAKEARALGLIGTLEKIADLAIRPAVRMDIATISKAAIAALAKEPTT